MHPAIYPEFIQHNPTHLESKFALLWVDLFPNIDLHFQYPLDGYPRSKYDFAHVPSRTGIDLQGGNRVQGMGHTSPSGVRKDATKQRRAMEYGWALIPVMGDDVEDASKLEQIAKIIEIRWNF